MAVTNCYTYIVHVHVLYKLIKMKRHNPQYSSLHLFLGFPLGLFPATSPFITLLTTFILYHLFSPHLFSSLRLCYHCFLLQYLSYSFFSHTLQSGYTNHTPQNFISAACNLTLSLSFNTHVSHPYTRVVYYHALYTVIFVSMLNSLFPNICFSQDPTTVLLVPSSSSILPFSLNLTLDIPSPLLALAVHPQLLFCTPWVPC